MNNKDETLENKPKKLQLTKTIEGGQVQQNFGHGRRAGPAKMVTVEVRKTRVFSQDSAGRMVKEDGGAAAAFKKAPEETVASSPVKTQNPTLGGLTEEERNTRMNALQNASSSWKTREQEAELRAQQAEEKKRLAEEAKKLEAENQEKAKSGAKKEQPKVSATEEHSAPKPAGERLMLGLPGADDKKKGKFAEGYEAKPKRGLDDKRRGKINLANAFQEEERVRSLASIKRAREKAKRLEGGPREAEKIVREVIIPEVISVQELANRMAVRGVDVVKALMKLGVMATPGQTLDADTAELIVTEFGHKFKRVTEGDVENVLKDDNDTEENLVPRPPVVTIMGHVDHGKTSLLDAMRQTDVALKEAGGITQHIGAYQITLPKGEKITFIDTPGHEAFTAMRARGAKVTDIVVLVVAADDGVMPQTIEAINHARSAEVPIIVAINKIDKPGANSRKLREELLSHNLVSEEFGGDTQIVEVSAKQKLNLDKLQDAIMVQAEMLELKANSDRNALGAVIEAQVDKGRGIVATFLVQKGRLKIGQIVVAGTATGKIRAIMDDKGNALKEALPSMPVVVLGLDELPNAGDEFNVVENDRQAREITEYRSKRVRDIRSKSENRLSLEQMFQNAGLAKAKELNVVIKADVQGSAEAIIGSITRLSNEEITVKVVHSAAGGITESDVALARAVDGIIIGFNVRANNQAKEQAAREGVDIRYYSIIYNVVDDIKAALAGMMSPVIRENFLGYAEIREVFTMSKYGKVAGCMVTQGIVKRGAGVRLLRDNVVIHQGKLKTLKRFKDDVKEVKEGFECGMAFENYDDIKQGDVIEAFEMVEEARSL